MSIECYLSGISFQNKSRFLLYVENRIESFCQPDEGITMGRRINFNTFPRILSTGYLPLPSRVLGVVRSFKSVKFFIEIDHQIVSNSKPLHSFSGGIMVRIHGIALFLRR